jgi:seryl-tRNA synthetase
LDTESVHASSTLDVTEAEASVAQARAALDESRQATKAAEETFRARQADEATALQAYEQAAHGVRDAYAAERARIEEQMRTAEHELKALDARLSELEVSAAPAPAASEPTSIGPSANGSRASEASIDVPPATDSPANGPEDGAAYEDDWYRTLKHRSESGSTGEAE